MDKELLDDMKTAKPYLVDDHSTAKLWYTKAGRWAVTGPAASGWEIYKPDEKRDAILSFAGQIPRG